MLHILLQLEYKKITFVLCFCIFFCVTSISAESMSGGVYTLNGSLQVVTNQGESSTYVLNPGGDTILTNNASGGTYTLYPSGYNRESTVTPLTSALSSQLSFSGSREEILYTQSTSTLHVPIYVGDENLYPVNYNTQENKITPYDNSYGFGTNKKFKFGEKVFTEKVTEVVKITRNITLIWIICVGLFLISLHIWRKYHMNK